MLYAFLGGILIITGWYGLLEVGYSTICCIGLAWGGFIFGIAVNQK